MTQYDVELYQRIEKLLGAKLDEHPTEEAEVLQYLQRVQEAQRAATAELKDLETRKRERSAGDSGRAKRDPGSKRVRTGKGGGKLSGKRR